MILNSKLAHRSYLIFRLLIVVIPLLTQLIIIVLVLVEFFVIHIVLQFFKLEGFAGIPVNGTGDEFLLDVFTEMIVKLESLLELS